MIAGYSLAVIVRHSEQRGDRPPMAIQLATSGDHPLMAINFFAQSGCPLAAALAPANYAGAGELQLNVTQIQECSPTNTMQIDMHHAALRFCQILCPRCAHACRQSHWLQTGGELQPIIQTQECLPANTV
jgi:hypothetical protein